MTTSSLIEPPASRAAAAAAAGAVSEGGRDDAAPRPRVLFIGAGAPWAGGAGHLVRQRMFIEALERVAELHLALFDYDPTDAMVPARWASVTAVPGWKESERSKSRWGRLFTDLMLPQPRVATWTDYSAARGVVARLRPETFDAVFAYRVDFAHMAGVLDHPRLLLDVDDPEHVRQSRALATRLAGGRPDWRTGRDLVKLARFEKTAVRNARAAFVCQDQDAAAFAPTAVRVVPNCVEVPETPPVRGAAGARLLFLGNCSAGPNAANPDGLSWFCREVWPIVRKELPRAEFVVAGKDSDRYATGEGVRALGFVEDLDKLYASAAASVAPIRFGTGTRIKILESFAHACPVISTPMGCDGIAAAHDRDILIGADPGAFAEQCVRVLTEPGLGRRIGLAGYEHCLTRYSVSRQRGELVRTLHSLLRSVSAR